MIRMKRKFTCFALKREVSLLTSVSFMRSFRTIKKFFYHRLLLSITILVFLLLLPASYFVYMEEQGNFHPITSGEAYRSAILDRDELEYYIKKYNIKSILNLLGKHPNQPWYREEIKVSAENQIKHYDISLSAIHEPTQENARALVDIFLNAPPPILIHCKSGADRTGLVAAMWKVVVDKETKTEAKKQLSLVYGHVPIGKTTALDRFFQNWDPNPRVSMTFAGGNP